MATSDCTHAPEIHDFAGITLEDFPSIATNLNRYGALLAGVEAICNTEEVGADALSVAGTVCREINQNICRLADRLDAMGRADGVSLASESFNRGHALLHFECISDKLNSIQAMASFAVRAMEADEETFHSSEAYLFRHIYELAGEATRTHSSVT